MHTRIFAKKQKSLCTTYGFASGDWAGLFPYRSQIASTRAASFEGSLTAGNFLVLQAGHLSWSPFLNLAPQLAQFVSVTTR